MDKLSQFYIDLATDAEKMALFNRGQTEEEKQLNRQEMLSEAGIDTDEALISLTQEQLQEVIEARLVEQASEWQNVCLKSCGNTNNDIGQIGLR